MSDAEVVFSNGDIIRWWESRRLRFNFLVGAVGVVTWFLVLFAGGAAVKPGVDFEEPIGMIFGPIIYGILANICYTLGWLTDVIFGKGRPTAKLYRTGLIFSLCLTALPGLWAVFCWIHSLITGQKLD